MTNDVKNRDQLIRAAIRRALNEEWDPIGVGPPDGVEDEYDSYIPAICNLLVSRRSWHEMFEYLWWLETVHMALTGNRRKTEKFAERLLLIPDEVDAILMQPGSTRH
jgi:hypothetical protein